MYTSFAQPSNAAPAGDKPAAQTGAPATNDAPQQGAGSSPGGSGFMLLAMMLPILLLFLTMRNQNKKQKQIESSLKVGDQVVTQSGVIGKIVEMGETRAKIEIAPGVSVKMLKSAISGLDGGEAKPAEGKDSKGEKDKQEKAKA